MKLCKIYQIIYLSTNLMAKQDFSDKNDKIVEVWEMQISKPPNLVKSEIIFFIKYKWFKLKYHNFWYSDNTLIWDRELGIRNDLKWW